MANVPNTTTFTLQDVYDSVSSHDATVQDNLVSCFDKSVASYFDSNYGSKTMDPKTLYGFRNYSIVEVPVILYTDRLVIVGGSETTASASGRIPSIGPPYSGDPSVTEYGFVYSTSTYPTINDGKILAETTNIITGTVYFSSTITGLTEGQLYYVRAYATNPTGTYYGSWSNLLGSHLEGVPFVPNNYYIGRALSEGFVADVFYQSGDLDVWNVPYGLIMHSTDIGSYTWACGGFNDADHSNYGSGAYNTNQIVASCSQDGAAKACYNLTTGGYTDWFLPSEGELDLLFQNMIGALSDIDYYWSSTEYRDNVLEFDNAYARNALAGGDIYYKGNTFQVRPCRYIRGGDHLINPFGTL